MSGDALTKDEVYAFVQVVDEMSKNGKTIAEAQAKLVDEGLTQVQAALIIQTWMELPL